MRMYIIGVVVAVIGLVAANQVQADASSSRGNDHIRLAGD